MGVLAWARAIGFLRDILTTLVGCAVLIATPPSWEEFGGDDVAVLAWSLLPLAGGLLCLGGSWMGSRQWECIGAFTTSSGFGLWSIAVMVQADTPNLTTWAVAGAFACLALSGIVRGLIVATGLLTRTVAP